MRHSSLVSLEREIGIFITGNTYAYSSKKYAKGQLIDSVKRFMRIFISPVDSCVSEKDRYPSKTKRKDRPPKGISRRTWKKKNLEYQSSIYVGRSVCC